MVPVFEFVLFRFGLIEFGPHFHSELWFPCMNCNTVVLTQFSL